MPYPTDWRFMSSRMAGAPGGGDFGAYIRAMFESGFGSKTLSSLVADGSGIVTGTVDTGHQFEDLCVIRVEGASPAGFNGDYRITWVSATQFFYVNEALAGAGAATGTITAKVAPIAGWTKLYDEGGELCYYSSDADFCIRISATAGWRPIRLYRSMSGPTEGVGLIANPYVRMQHILENASKYWAWAFAGDSRSIVWLHNPFSSGTYMNTHGWVGAAGLLDGALPWDSAPFVALGAGTDSVSSANQQIAVNDYNVETGGDACPGLYVADGDGFPPMGARPVSMGTDSGKGGTYHDDLPNGAFPVHPVFLKTVVVPKRYRRGAIRGLGYVPQSISDNGRVVTGDVGGASQAWTTIGVYSSLPNDCWMAMRKM